VITNLLNDKFRGSSPGGEYRKRRNIMCENKASHRYTWPGKNESFICEEHLPELKAVAGAIGMYLQTIPLKDSVDTKCSQITKGR
jgi:hypothetical protein